LPATPPPTHEDLRELESRFDARFQAVSARFVRVDNKFATVENRLDEMDHRHQTLTRHLDAQFQQVDHQLAATSSQIEDVRTQVRGQIGLVVNKIDRLGRVVLFGNAVATASLCMGTVVLVI
jgi:hypothetical protein